MSRRPHLIVLPGGGSMEMETYRPARLILLGEDASPELRRATSLDALVKPSSPPFFL
jgi:hypothetical protein